MILDTGFLISIDRDELSAKRYVATAHSRNTPLVTTHPVVAQVWRNGARQARLSKFLDSTLIYPFDDGPEVGALLARSNTADVVDAHIVSLAVRLSQPVLTGDVEEIGVLAAAARKSRPQVVAWP